MTPHLKASRDLDGIPPTRLLRTFFRPITDYSLKTGASDMVWEIYLPWRFRGNFSNKLWELWGYRLTNMFNLTWL